MNRCNIPQNRHKNNESFLLCSYTVCSEAEKADDFPDQLGLGCRKAPLLLNQNNQAAYKKACNGKPANTSGISFRFFRFLMPESNGKEKQNHQQP